MLTFITGRDAAMQLTHSGRSCISQHFFDGNDRIADEADVRRKHRIKLLVRPNREGLSTAEERI
ncbi:hypothetical protein [Ruegeria sp. PrR005]|uniref:Uncharacterized protein n=1 Tax=Ruegeria sp. PrR005 TaxID=2706882 RepID=A0A6B2NSD9_9RHOB|nr:hypothetical protein [Ruegeria sp. PrR005]NDW46318.1 hypothetical protein [Ruegeria sp. PrR005]